MEAVAAPIFHTQQAQQAMIADTFDVFAVIGLPAIDTQITLQQVKSYCRRTVMSHVFERSSLLS